MDKIKDVRRSFTSYVFSLRNGDRSKKRLSNRFTIEVPNERAETTIRMTIREAETLRNFLNQHLG